MAAPALLAEADQKKPSDFLNRDFANDTNLSSVINRAEATLKFPNLTTDQSLALAAFALARLRLAQKCRAVADNAEIAGSVAGWDAEIAAAQALADQALAAVAAAYPRFRSGDAMYDLLKEYSEDSGEAVSVYHPAALASNWFTAANAAPTANNVTVNLASGAAVNSDIKALSSAADADSDVIYLSEINGVDVPAVGTVQVVVNGVTLTAARTGVVTAPAGANNVGPKVVSTTFRIADDEGGETAAKTLTINFAAP